MPSNQQWTYVWMTDDGPSLGPVCASEHDAKFVAFAEWRRFSGGSIGSYHTGNWSEFERLLASTPDLWILPLAPLIPA